MTTTDLLPEAQAPKAAPCEMKFQISREELLPALELVMKSVPTRRNYPDILFHVLIVASTDQITLSGTNLNAGMVVEVPANVERTGIFTINARVLLNCVRTFPKAGSVTLEVKEGRVVVTGGKRSFSLKDGTDGSDFPNLNGETSQFGTVQASHLRHALSETLFAAGSDDSQWPVFTSVQIHMRADTVLVTAADGYRLAERMISLGEVTEERDAVLLVPVEALRLLLSVLPQNGEVTLTWNDERVGFSAGPMRFLSTRHEGTFPLTISPEYQTTFTLERSALLSLLHAFKPITSDGDQILRLSYSENGVVFKASCETLGEASEELMPTAFSGKTGHRIFNASFLMDLLKHMPEERFRFSVSGYGQPSLIVSVGRFDYRYSVMPMEPNR